MTPIGRRFINMRVIDGGGCIDINFGGIIGDYFANILPQKFGN